MDAQGFRPSLDSTAEADELRDLARRRVKAKRDFLMFLIVWVVVSATVVAIWALTEPSYFWPVWPILGMGIGAVFLGIEAYGPARRTPSEAEVDRELERMRQRRA